MINNTDQNRPSSPLVKQLKQKFDRMVETNEHNKSHSPSHIGHSKVPRVGHDEGNGAYPLLPVRCFSFLTLFDHQIKSRIYEILMILFLSIKKRMMIVLTPQMIMR